MSTISTNSIVKWSLVTALSTVAPWALTISITDAGKECSEDLYHNSSCVNVDSITEPALQGDADVSLNSPNQRIRGKRSPQGGGDVCVLPPYPQHGSYVVIGQPDAVPGQAFDTVRLNIICNPGYGVIGKKIIVCVKGWMSDEMPTCVHSCRLQKDPSVSYYCVLSGEQYVEGYRQCNEYEPVGTMVRPECNAPSYYNTGVLSRMRCTERGWNYIAICRPECGKVTSEGEQLIAGGHKAMRGEFPWHVGIYRKTTSPYEQICGGSLISSSVVISAAHCFWDQFERKVVPASRYAVAVGKLYRPWNNPNDVDAQKSEVSDIKIPLRFKGAVTRFQHDIAVVMLTTTIEFQTYVMPVCVDFDQSFERRQLRGGNMGKVSGWGLTQADYPETPSPVLKVAKMPYIPIAQCLDEAPPAFEAYITGDKICAGHDNGTAVCKGDSGGGLVFKDVQLGTRRYYLRGIVSTAPNTPEKACNVLARAAFTQISVHTSFIEEYTTFYGDNAVNDQASSEPPAKNANCILPAYPQHGSYTVSGAPDGYPGEGFNSVQIAVTCNPGYQMFGNSNLHCSDGNWNDNLPQCIRFCKLSKHPSVEYRCLINGNNYLEGSRDCFDQEPAGTVVIPECRASYYYSGVLNFMRCIDGSWDYVAICTPDCGRISPRSRVLRSIGGRYAEWGEIPWHAGIYKWSTTSYTQICGGTLVRETVVISAGHCFWDGQRKKLSEEKYAVAVGKIYRAWDNFEDVAAQKFDVKDVKVPSRFQGPSAYFQDNIAVVILSAAVEYNANVRPVCVDFDTNFDRNQLRVDNKGKIAGWGLTESNGKPSEVLKIVELPYVAIEKCIAESPPRFRHFITSDKFCAGYLDGTAALCVGDAGGGLVFMEPDRGTERYYLRGILSTAPPNNSLCNAYTWAFFTHVKLHGRFLNEILH